MKFVPNKIIEVDIKCKVWFYGLLENNIESVSILYTDKVRHNSEKQ